MNDSRYAATARQTKCQHHLASGTETFTSRWSHTQDGPEYGGPDTRLSWRTVSATARSTRTLGVALVAALATALLPSAASASTVWLCRPGLAADPCTPKLTASVLSPTGSVRGIEHTSIPARPPIDCFYVYPTVSQQPTPAANLHIDPQERAIALFQASRFSTVCRVFAPMYRQLTLMEIGKLGSSATELLATAYGDVLAAWHEYLSRYNHGRGVVLIGHSQGSIVLTRLAREQIDSKPAIRRRLVSAILPGGNVLVPRGSDVGGTFHKIRACRSARQTGCIVAYSTFDATPPAGSFYGRSYDPRMQVLCTNPAALGGGSGLLRSYVPTEHFPGAIGSEVSMLLGPQPPVRTPWISYPDAYRAHCSTAAGASVLAIHPVGGARLLRATPDATWGLHLADVNIALGNLVNVVRSQTAAYLRH